MLLIIPVSGCNLSGDNSLEPPPPPLVPDEVIKKVKEGDFILRQGGGAFSEKIIEFMGEERHFSHIGMVANINGKLRIIHSVSEELSGRDGVQTQSIRAFSNDIADSNYCIIRPKMEKAEIDSMMSKAKLYLKHRLTFDYDYNTDDSTQLYCIELAYFTYGTVMGKDRFDIKDCGDGVYIPLFATFFKPEYFETVYCLKEY
jgi:hypothetical protein